MSPSPVRPPAACTALILFVAMPAQADPWTYSTCGGIATGYVAKPYWAEFGWSWLGTASASRAFGNRVALRVTSGYMRFSRRVADSGEPERIYADIRQTVEFVPLGLGVRVFHSLRASAPARPFIELTPALFWTRVGHRVHYDGWAPHTNTRLLRTDYHSRERFVPGLDAAFGLEGSASRLHVEWAVHYVVTNEFGEVDPGGWYFGRYRGLRQLAMTAGLAWAP